MGTCSEGHPYRRVTGADFLPCRMPTYFTGPLSKIGPEKPATTPLLKQLTLWRHACADWLMSVAKNRYRPLLRWALQHHFLVAGFFW